MILATTTTILRHIIAISKLQAGGYTYRQHTLPPCDAEQQLLTKQQRGKKKRRTNTISSSFIIISNTAPISNKFHKQTNADNSSSTIKIQLLITTTTTTTINIIFYVIVVIMASSSLPAASSSSNSICIPSNLLAAVITFEHKGCSGSPDRYIERYCQTRKHGGGDISTVIYPWKGDRDQALVIFEEEYTPKDVVHTLASRKQPPITNIVEFVESQCFGCVETCVSPALLEKLLTQYTVEKIVSRLELETGIRATVEDSQNRLSIKGFYFQIKLAEEALNKLKDEIGSSSQQAGPDSSEDLEAEPTVASPDQSISGGETPSDELRPALKTSAPPFSGLNLASPSSVIGPLDSSGGVDEPIDDLTSAAESAVDNPLVVPNTDYASLTAPADDPNLPALTDDPHLATVLDNSRASDITIDQDSSASTDNAKPTVPPHDPSFTTPVVSPKSHVDDSHSSDSTVDRDAPAENTNSSINTDDPSFTRVDDSNSSTVVDDARFAPVADDSHSFDSAVNQDSSTPTNNSKSLKPSDDPSVSTPADELNSSAKVDVQAPAVVTDESNLPDSEVASGPAAPGNRPNSSTHTDAHLAALVDEPQSFDPTADEYSLAATDDPKSSTPPVNSRSASQTVDQGTANNTNSIPIGDQSPTDPASTVSGTAASSDKPSAEAESSQTNITESEQDQESSNKKVNDSEENKQFNAFNPSNRRIIPSLPDAFVLSSGSKEGSVEPVDHRENLEPEPSGLLPEEARLVELQQHNTIEVVTTSPRTPSTATPVTTTASSGAVAISSAAPEEKPKSAPASLIKSAATRVRSGSTPTTAQPATPGEEPEVTAFRATVTVTSTLSASTTTTTSTTLISSAPATSKSAEGPSVPAEPAPNSSSTDNSNLESTVGAKSTSKKKLSAAERLSREQEGDLEVANSERQESADDTTNMSGKDNKSKALKVEEDFDQIYYEFMRIIRVRDFQARILDKYDGQIHEKEHPKDSRVIRIQITSHTPGEAAKMMNALNEMFYEINRSVHSHSTKLLYDGDKDKLALSLSKGIRDPKLGFIARLVTKEDIRIIGSIANMDRDVSIVENYIGEYKKMYPAAPVTKVTQSDIALPNGTVVTVMEGDLTKMKSEAVVSSSGSDLSHRRGVSRAIAQACGQRFCAQGRQFIKTGGELKFGDTFVQPADGRMVVNGVRYIIHAIAPAKTTNIIPLLVKTVSNALKEADSLKCRTVALPAICAGNMGVPLETCAECYWTALVKYSTENHLPKIKQILFVVDDPVMVLQIHQVMSSMSLGSTAASTGGTAASSGDTAVSAGDTAASSGDSGSSQQQTPSGQRKRGGGAGAEEWNDGVSDERGPCPNGKKETRHTGAAKSHIPGSADVENRGSTGGYSFSNIAQGIASGVSSLFGVAGADGTFDSQREHWKEPEQHSRPYPSDHRALDHTTTDPQNDSSNTSVGGQRGVGYREDESTTGVHGYARSSANAPGGKAAYIPRADAATHTAAARVSRRNAGAAAVGTTKPNDKECPICMEEVKDPIALPCSHKFCKDCVDQVVKTAKSNLCPTCRTPFRNAEGKQPIGGTMSTHRSRVSLPGYLHSGSITIMYNIPGGIQGPEHPNPGQHYKGTSRTAYLPDNTKGRRAEKLLRKAFNQRLVFTIGQSVTTGRDNCVVWNDIHHKTNTSGGASNYGYPDPDYLDRLIEDLKAKGITD